MNNPQDIADIQIDQLDRHASLLAGHRLESATKLRDAAGGELADLMRLAERVGHSLQPVVPEPNFRRSLREALHQESQTALAQKPLARIPGAARLAGRGRLSSRRARGLIGGGAAVAAVVGVAAFYWLGKNGTERVTAG